MTRKLAFILAILWAGAAHAQIPASCVAATNIYYIDNVGGLDSHTQTQAKTKATAWAHQPYMASFTGAYSHTAGDCFVFKGGDTWVNTDLGIVIASGGNSGIQDYYGVDLTWFSGGSFSRPIIDIQSTVTPAKIVDFQAGDVTFDNFEIINASCDSSHSQLILSPDANHKILMTNNYIHSFKTPSGGCPSHEVQVEASGGTPPSDNLIDHNIVNGADGNAQGGYYVEAFHGNDTSPLTNNIIHDVCSAINEDTHLVAYNTIYNVGQSASVSPFCSSTGGFHPDCIQTDADSDIHDNLIYNCTGEWVQLSPHADVNWPVSHVYNNVLFTQAAFPYAPPPAVQLGTGGDAFSGGVAFIYNNTMQCGADGCIFVEQNPMSAITVLNNHQITASGTAQICINNAPFNNGACQSATTFTYSAGSELYQTPTAATSAGYTEFQTYAYSPTASNSGTVGIGTNETSQCSATILLCVDTQYGSLVATGNIAAAGRATHSRPSSGAWDAGAYEFLSSTGSSVGGGVKLSGGVVIH